jgi:hypothetical protein
MRRQSKCRQDRTRRQCSCPDPTSQKYEPRMSAGIHNVIRLEELLLRSLQGMRARPSRRVQTTFHVVVRNHESQTRRIRNTLAPTTVCITFIPSYLWCPSNNGRKADVFRCIIETICFEDSQLSYLTCPQCLAYSRARRKRQEVARTNWMILFVGALLKGPGSAIGGGIDKTRSSAADVRIANALHSAHESICKVYETRPTLENRLLYSFHGKCSMNTRSGGSASRSMPLGLCGQHRNQLGREFRGLSGELDGG